MSSAEVWAILMHESKKAPLELQTKMGLHFMLHVDGERLVVSTSRTMPASKLIAPRQIYKSNFEKVYPYYERKENGERGLSKEIQHLTGNSVYIFAAIKYAVNLKVTQ